MSQWQKQKIGDLGRVVTGHTPPTAERKYYGDQYPLIKPTDMEVDGRYIGEVEEKVSQECYGKFGNDFIPANTPCVVTIGTIGKLCLTTELSLCNQAVNSILVNRNKHDSIFTFYLMRLYNVAVKHLSSGTASGRENVSKSAFENIEIKTPPLPVQRKIAAVLSAYDDLIENNTRRIALLEKMAEEIYREWFVRLCFPGHEQVTFHKGIPEGWERVKIEELTELIKRGVSPHYDDSSDRLVVNQRCIRNGAIDLSFARQHRSKVPKQKILKHGDILINSTGVGTLGRVSIVEFEPKNLTVDSHVTICRADTDKVNKYFLAHSVKRLQQYFEYMAVGATGQVELGRELISSTEILIPSLPLQNMYEDIVAKVWQQKSCLSNAVQNLRQTRDRLLTRLISGKLSVEDLDIQFPPSMKDDAPDPQG